MDLEQERETKVRQAKAHSQAISEVCKMVCLNLCWWRSIDEHLRHCRWWWKADDWTDEIEPEMYYSRSTDWSQRRYSAYHWSLLVNRSLRRDWKEWFTPRAALWRSSKRDLQSCLHISKGLCDYRMLRLSKAIQTKAEWWLGCHTPRRSQQMDDWRVPKKWLHRWAEDRVNGRLRWGKHLRLW